MSRQRDGSHGIWRRLAAALAVLAVFAVATPARAGFLTGFSGNTAPASTLYPGAGVAGVVNFTVLDRTGGVAGDSFGTGVSSFNSLFAAGTASGAFDSTAKYLYLFETYNNGVNGTSYPVSQNTVFISSPMVNVTSFGTFTGAAFSSSILGVQAAYGNPSGVTTGVTPVIVTGSLGRTPEVGLGSSSILALYKFGTNLELQAGQHSILWGYTSNIGPILATTSIQDGGTSGVGFAPSAAVPEPWAFLSMAIGLPALGLALRSRRGSGSKS